MPWALVFAFASAGNSSAAKIAMMAMTTRSSMRVKPWGKKERHGCPLRNVMLQGFMLAFVVRDSLFQNEFPMRLVVPKPAASRLIAVIEEKRVHLDAFHMIVAEDNIQSPVMTLLGELRAVDAMHRIAAPSVREGA